MKTNKKMLELLELAADSLQLHRLGSAKPAVRRIMQDPQAHGLSPDTHGARPGPAGHVHPDAPWQRKQTGARRQARAPRGEGSFTSRAYVNDAGSRDYMLYVPSGYSGQPLPLIVMLHGCKQNPQDFAVGTRMNQLAEESRCLVAYPAQATGANSFRCWNWFNTSDQQRERGEPSIIAGITKQIMADYRVDSRRVYIAGLSAGGSMAVIMAHTYPELYAAVGVHSGLAYGGAQDVYSAILAMRRGAQFISRPAHRSVEAANSALAISTIVFHGDMDKTVHPDNGDQVIAHSAPNSSDGVPPAEMGTTVRHGEVEGGHAFTQTIYLDGAANPVAEQWVVHGEGHSWSGGDPAGSFTDPKGPDASREMVRFFLAHPHPA